MRWRCGGAWTLVRRGAPAACLAAAVIGTAGCGRKGPPLAPFVRVPAPVDDLTLRRVADEVYVTFTIPARNVDGSTPPDITRLELFAMTTAAPPAPSDFERTEARVATVAVTAAAPEVPAEPPSTGAARTAAPGERVTIRDTLPPAAGAADPAGTTRFYMALAYGPRGRTRPGGRIASIPAGPAPPAPDGLSVTFTADAVSLSWAAVPGVAGYHVYRTGDVPAEPSADAPPQPLTSSPLETAAFSEAAVFGVPRCYRVRSIAAGDMPIESAASPAACLTPEDIFPPSAPTELTAVAGPDGIALRWTPSPESDVAGYVVLRGTTADDTLLPITDVPVAEPRLLDRDVVSGVRYVYAVVAVDARQPTPNRSPESPRDAVTAR